MIAFLRGELLEKNQDTIIVECGGVGYELFVTPSMSYSLAPIGHEVRVHTFLQVKDDGFTLFGFQKKEELAIFKMLIKVSGLGPKGALAILSVLSVKELKFAILSSDAKSISKAPGVGVKTAQKLILELKDKFDLQTVYDEAMESNDKMIMGDGETENQSAKTEAILALVALGYSNQEALRAVSGVEIKETTSVEELLKLALKRIGL